MKVSVTFDVGARERSALGYDLGVGGRATHADIREWVGRTVDAALEEIVARAEARARRAMLAAVEKAYPGAPVLDVLATIERVRGDDPGVREIVEDVRAAVAERPPNVSGGS